VSPATVPGTFFSTGIRSGELRNLKREYIDFRKGFARIDTGKGEKDRMVPLGKFALRYLENYLKFVRGEFYNSDNLPYLFVSKMGSRFSDVGLIKIHKKYAEMAGISKNVTPHVFRHTCATHLVQQNANLRCVQQLLGHESLLTTQVYVHLTINDLKQTHQKCHPREQETLI